SLVTGGNGHLGNNLIRLLLSNNQKVRTTVRNINNTEPFNGLDCEVVQADITDRESLKKAFQGVTNLYAVAANFSMWAKNPKLKFMIIICKELKMYLTLLKNVVLKI